MAPLRRNLKTRLNVCASLLSLFVVACGGAAPSYAPPPTAYYGGGAAPSQAMPAGGAAEAPIATAPMVDMASQPAPSSGSSESYDSEGGSDDSGFFGASAKKAVDEPAAKAPAMAPAARAPMGAPAVPAKPTPPPAQPKPGTKTDGPADQAPARPAAPLLIYTGNVGMEVPEPAAVPKTIDKIIDLAESFGGYLAGRSDSSVTIRVPSGHFRDSMNALEKLGEVKRRSVNAQDVSEQYHDLEVRLANLKTVQKRLQDFLARAANVSDALQVEHELERIGQEIDHIEGRLRFLRSQATFSTITVDLSAKPKQQAVVAQGNVPPPPPRTADLPIDWLSRIGLETLLTLR